MNIENKIIKPENKELSAVATSDNMLEFLKSGDFKYTQEIKIKVIELMKKVMEIEKNITEDDIKNEFKINVDKFNEFNSLDGNYKTNMLSRYKVYKNLTADEIRFIEKYKNNVKALNNIVEMYNEAKKYIVTEGAVKADDLAA